MKHRYRGSLQAQRLNQFPEDEAHREGSSLNSGQKTFRTGVQPTSVREKHFPPRRVASCGGGRGVKRYGKQESSKENKAGEAI